MRREEWRGAGRPQEGGQPGRMAKPVGRKAVNVKQRAGGRQEEDR